MGEGEPFEILIQLEFLTAFPEPHDHLYYDTMEYSSTSIPNGLEKSFPSYPILKTLWGSAHNFLYADLESVDHVFE